MWTLYQIVCHPIYTVYAPLHYISISVSQSLSQRVMWFTTWRSQLLPGDLLLARCPHAFCQSKDEPLCIQWQLFAEVGLPRSVTALFSKSLISTYSIAKAIAQTESELSRKHYPHTGRDYVCIHCFRTFRTFCPLPLYRVTFCPVSSCPGV